MRPNIALHVGRMVASMDMRDMLRMVTVPCAIFQANEDSAVPEYLPTYIISNLGQGMSSSIHRLNTRGHLPPPHRPHPGSK
ncbi:hypothetical protein C2S52_002844 [Perilla frutescens var. hirtella]|nr:hypothetical protein C2S52_002844 [Perilla frutescens var. hirtella]